MPQFHPARRARVLIGFVTAIAAAAAIAQQASESDQPATGGSSGTETPDRPAEQPPARQETPTQSQASAQSLPSFTLDIRAPDPLRSVLDRHLELRRFTQVPDLDDAELDRLLTLAETNTRELAGTLGYFEPKISIRRENAAGKPHVIVEVQPGPPAVVLSATVDFEGAIAQQPDAKANEQMDAIRRDWRLPPGHLFTQDDWERAKTHALQQLVTKRYPLGKISYSLADIDAADSWARLGLRLDSGPAVRLGQTHVQGAQRYESVLAARLARLAPGSDYDQDAITQAQLRLTGSGYYDTAFIVVDTSGDPNAAPVELRVREAPLHRVVYGLGFASDSGVRASVEYRNNKVPGTDLRAVTQLQLETKQPFVQSEWTAMPDERGWRWGTLGRLERLDDGTLITRSGKLRFGRSVTGDSIDRNVYLQFDRSLVEPAEGVPLSAIPDNGDGTSVTANYVWTGRYFDSMPYPTRGFGLTAEFAGGYTLTGSKSPFARTDMRWLGIQPLPDGRLQLRAEFGAVVARSEAKVPATQLFRTGGDTTVRGYGYRDIGVEQANGVIAPGRYLTVGSVEWQKPIRRNELETPFEAVLFLDGGAVANSISQMEVAWGVGTGVRYKSPLGPFEVDVAYGLRTHGVRLHFNIGFTF